MRPYVVLLMVLCVAPIAAQQRPVVTADDYAHAERFLGYNTSPLVFGVGVRPTWLADGRFWYRIAIPQGFRRIDDEVHHNLAELCAASPDRWQILAEIGDQGHVAGHRHFEQPQHSLYGFGHIHRFQDVTLFSGIDHELTDNLGAADRHVPDRVEFFIGS